MSFSQPSSEIFALEVPDTRNFTATFQYNFFVTDEKINELSTTINQQLFQKSSEELGSIFETQNAAKTKIPRWISLRWTLPPMTDGDLTNQFATNNKGQQFNRNLLKTNFDKIVTEDLISANKFVSLSFQNAQLSDEIYYALSGTYTRAKLNNLDASSDNAYKISNRIKQLSNQLSVDFINNAFLQPIYGKKQYINMGGKKSYEKIIDDVKIHSQINAKFLPSLVLDSVSELDTVMANNTIQYMNSVSMNALSRDATDENHNFSIPYIDIQKYVANTIHLNETQLVGYVIDKFEIKQDGTIIDKPNIFIENASVTETTDFSVKYDGIYAYQIRAIYKMQLLAADDVTGELAILTILVSSSPSSKQYVICTEDVAPPSPVDIGFVWDYVKKTTSNKIGSLMLHWTMPVNVQRDIKYLQILRRKTIQQSFELVKMFDFDDSSIKAQLKENIASDLIEQRFTTFWFDDDFDKTSKYIYTLATIDAHGLISNYSAQFEVWFDVFENALKKRLISHSGALRQYPNLFIENDLFVDSIKTTGFKSLKIYFNPEYYYLKDLNDRDIRLISTNQNGGKFQLQTINLDNQKQQTLNIHIDDILNKVK